MEDWTTYTKSKNGVGSSEKSDKPNAMEYLFIKATDNSLAIAVFILCLVFGFIGLFSGINASHASWALHASELCLGVFLGLLAKKH